MNRILIIPIILFIVGCNNKKEIGSRVDSLPYYSEATFTPNWLENNSDSLENFHRISDFKLINQNGEIITQKSFDDKIYVTDFFFTICPGICPKMTDNMKIIQDEFINDDEILLLSHSVTPERDSVPVLKAYAEEKGINAKRWHIVTGDRQEIYNLGRQQYFVEEDLGLEKDPDEFLHTENFILVDKNKHIRGIYNGINKASINQLVADIKTLKKE